MTRIEIQARYRENNREKLKERSRLYYQTHKEQHKLLTRKYRLAHKNLYTKAVKKYQRKNWIKTSYAQLKKTSKQRNFNQILTFDEFSLIRIKNCFYCSKPASQKYGGGLDRINNEKGYIISNVLPCCGNCNRVRCNVLSVEEMQLTAKTILDFRRSRGIENNGL